MNRTDNGKASVTLNQLYNYLHSIELDFLHNDNIGRERICKKDLQFSYRVSDKFS